MLCLLFYFSLKISHDLGRNIEKIYYLIFVRMSVSGLRLVDLAGTLSSSNIDGVDGVWISHFNQHRSFYDFISPFLLSYLVSIVGYIKPWHSKLHLKTSQCGVKNTPLHVVFLSIVGV